MRNPSMTFRCCLPLLFAFFLAAGDALAQDRAFLEKQRKQKYERTLDRHDYQPPAPGFRAVPPGPIHCCAEWEASEGVMMLWENYDLINELQKDNMVYIVVDNQSQKNYWTNQLNNHGIPLTNIDFWIINTDTVWTRDYGPWFIYDGNNDMGVVNYSCDEHGAVYGPNDDAFPFHFAGLYGINYYDMGLEHVGGNWYPNAYDKAFSSTRVYTQNPFKSKALTDGLIQDYLGIGQYPTAPVAPWTIEHLDCWIKPASPDTVIVVQYQPYSDYYRYGEEINEFYETLESPWGRPYTIHRLPMFKMGSGWYEFKPYMNSLVSNRKVFVPICYSPDDQVALDVFQEAFEGYQIVGVDHMGMGFNDAVHCRTRNFVRRDAIRIYPLPPGDTEDTVSGYKVTAEVIPPKGSALLAGYPVIRWTLTGGPPFSDVVMSPAGPADTYEGDIPPQALGSGIDFYIEAQDDGGHSTVYPLVAPDGMMSFAVRQDTEAPVLSRCIPTRSGFTANWPPEIRALCKDDMAEPAVTVEWSLNGVPQPDAALDREEHCYFYSGAFPCAPAPGDVVRYRLKASDGAASPNVSYLPKVGEYCCPVAGTGGVAVVDLATRSEGTAELVTRALGEWGIPCTTYTSWPADWSAHDVWFITLGVFVDHYILSQAEANELVAALQAGNNIYLESSDAWCYDRYRDTYKPWFGVSEVSDGGDLYGAVSGASGSLADGLSLEYWGESAWMDQIGAVTPAKMVFTSSGGKGRAVQHDAGTYRTVASAFPLGGLDDGYAPDTKREILLRMLDFFGVTDVRLHTTEAARLGRTVELTLEGEPGDAYALAASVAENYLPVGYGVYRIDFKIFFFLGQGVIPGSGEAVFPLALPPDDTFAGFEVHLQALTADSLAPLTNAALTNRQILTLVQ